MENTKLLEAAKLLIRVLDAGTVTDQGGILVHKPDEDHEAVMTEIITKARSDHELLRSLYELMNAGLIFAQTVGRESGLDFLSRMIHVELDGIEDADGR